MALFFSGRQWISPAVMSVVDDSKMYGRRPSDGNSLALVGRADGGVPMTALVFSSVSEAASVLRDGDLLRGVEAAFNASSESNGPATVTVVRINPATQSTLMLKDAAAADSIELKSTNYGLIDNQIKVKVEAGTNVGLKLTTQFGTSYNTVNDLYRNAFSVQYAGTGAGTLTVSNTAVSLSLNSVVTSIDLATFPTVQELVDRLGAIADITATVQDGNGEKASLNALDGVTAQDIKTAAYTATGTLQEAIDWFNSLAEGLVNATRPAAATKVPAPINFTYLAGGTSGVVTNTEWESALTELQKVDIQWLVPLTDLSAIHAMAEAHVAYMSNIARKERRCICGTAVGATDANAITAAKALNSDRVSLVHLGVYNYNKKNKLVLFPPYITAVMIAAAFSGLNPGTPLTNKSLKVSGLERKLINPKDTDPLILGGVLCLEDTPNGYKVIQSISTWLINDNYNRREVSVGMACDFMMRKVRATVESLRGTKNNPGTLALAVEMVKSALAALAVPEPGGPGVLAGDASHPAYRNLSITQDGDIMRIEFEASPVLPINYIPIVCYASPYSGSVKTLVG
jgi:hypothetical protein